MNDTSLRMYLNKLKQAKADLPTVVATCAEQATMRAVEVATDATPPKAGTGSGPYSSATGELKQHWATDSQVKPVVSGLGDTVEVQTSLDNNLPYASYVNDGHRLSRHFVPGLYINPETGVLERAPGKNVGIVVGTKTKYVKGVFMVDKAKKAYEDSLEAELQELIKELLA